MNKLDMAYLGDGVYVGHDDYALWLTVNSHENKALIAINTDILRNLVEYAERHLGYKNATTTD